MPTTPLRAAIAQAASLAEERADADAQCTLRLVSAALRDRDERARLEGRESADEREVEAMLGCLLRQCEAMAATCESEGDTAKAGLKRASAGRIRALLPAEVTGDELEAACRKAVSETGSRSLRDVGRCMNALRERFPDPQDLVRASGVVRGLLA